MTPKQQLARAANRMIRELLRAEGYVAAGRPAGTWWKPIDSESMAVVTCVALTTRFSPHVYVSPGYGLWFRPVHDLIATLIGSSAFSSRSTLFDRNPLALRALEARGHSMPKAGRWEFASLSEVEDQVPPLVETLTSAGYAWATAHANLASVTAELRAAPDIPAYAVWLPVALYLSGDFDDMAAELDKVLGHYAGKGGDYVEQYRRLAVALRSALSTTLVEGS